MDVLDDDGHFAVPLVERWVRERLRTAESVSGYQI